MYAKHITTSQIHVPDSKFSESLPCIYTKPHGDIKKSFNGKIKVSVPKWLKSFGQGSGLIMRVAVLIGNKKLEISLTYIITR